MIIPAIIPTSLDKLKTDLEAVTFAERVQIDIVDGQFVESLAWPYEPKGEVSELADLFRDKFVEVDLMVEDPTDTALAFVKAGAQSVIFHIETLTDPLAAINEVKKLQGEVGLAISNDTPLELIETFVAECDFVQVMGIATLGAQGAEFDKRCLERIENLRSSYPNLLISVDGAVSKETLPQLRKAGATRFVVGSALWTSEVVETTFNELSEM